MGVCATANPTNADPSGTLILWSREGSKLHTDLYGPRVHYVSRYPHPALDNDTRLEMVDYYIFYTILSISG
jgi:hypothetical protein